MSTSLSNPPGALPRRSFFLFLLLAPTGIFIIFAIIMVAQYKQFRLSVSPTPAVPELIFDSASKIRLDSLNSGFHRFTANSGMARNVDSLWLTGDDLTRLLASSPVVISQHLRFAVAIQDSLVTVKSTQSVQDMQGRFAWFFKMMAHSGYLNARLEGYPELKDGKLAFAPIHGFLNGQKVPAIALVKRGGMSPSDFLTEHEFYNAFVETLAEVKVEQGKILLVRR